MLTFSVANTTAIVRSFNYLEGKFVAKSHKFSNLFQLWLYQYDE